MLKDPAKVPAWLNVTKTLIPDFIVQDPKVENFVCVLNNYIETIVQEIFVPSVSYVAERYEEIIIILDLHVDSV